MLFWRAIFKEFLQASEGTKNALIASSLLHAPLYGTSAVSVTRLPVLQKHCVFHTWKNLITWKYLQVFEEPIEHFFLFFFFFNVIIFQLYLGIWDTPNVFSFLHSKPGNSIEILPNWPIHEEGSCIF